ncbi:MAG: helix-turn-helix transcriptional regulator [Bacteroidales bacterium]|nr:helix-turn-helix transcriptional regulator [Bacteroidales bacterium]
MNIELIRNNIVARRNKLGYSQEYVAVLLGISTNSYSKIENGHTAIISKRLFQIASALKTSVDELVLGENITLQEHQKICKELEEKYNKDIAYYRQHIDSCNLTIKTLQEATLEKESKIKEFTAQIARLQKPENHSAAGAGEMESNSAAGAGGLAGQPSVTGAGELAEQHPVTGAGELAGQHPVTGAGELAGQHPVTGAEELAEQHPVTGAGELAEQHPVTGAGRLAEQRPVTGAGRLAEQHPVTGAGELAWQRPVTGAGELAGQHPVTGAGELAEQHPVTGAGELAEQHPVTGEAGRGKFQTGAAEYVESHQADAGGLGNYPTGVAEFAVNHQAATAEMEDMTEPDDLPMNMAEPDGISRLV